MIFVEGELSAISGRAVRRVDMLMVPGGGDLEGVCVVGGGGGGGGGGESVIWDEVVVVDVVEAGGGSC